jgi:hypothetical protein
MAFDFTNPYGMVTGQPNLGSITPQPQPTQTPNPMGGGKNDKLSLMLYALGGALKGDKNFVQSTMQLQQMQEGKRKQEEQNKLWEKFKTEHSIDPQVAGLGDMMNPNQRLELMMKTMGGGKTGSSKRLSVFDPKTRQPVATVLESDFEGIKQAEADGYIVAPLSGPKDMDKDETTEFERNITELTKLKNIPAQQRTDTDVRNIKIYENKLLKTAAPKIYQIVGPDRTGIGLGTYDEFVQGQATGDYPVGSTIVNIPTDTKAPPSKKPEVFSAENKPFADRWQATSTLLDNLQNYTNELNKMDEAALTGTGAGAKFATSVIQNTKGFLKLASSDTKSYYNDQVANDTYTTVEGNDFMERLNKVSDQYGINESQVRDLAYLFAAARGQEGRGLSDKDYENALLIVSGGVGKRGKIAVIQSVYNRLGGEVSKTVDNRVKTLEYLRNNSEENQREYFDKQILQLDSLRKATPFNTYINPYAQQTPSASSLQNDPLGIR